MVDLVQTDTQTDNTVVALAQAGNRGRLKMSWQVGVGARLTDNKITIIQNYQDELQINSNLLRLPLY